MIGSIAALDLKKDYVLTGYRDHGHALACGMHPNAAMAELYGKVTAAQKEKGAPCTFDVENHMYGGNGIVGAQIPVAAGVAFRLSTIRKTVLFYVTLVMVPFTRVFFMKP